MYSYIHAHAEAQPTYMCVHMYKFMYIYFLTQP